MKHKESHQHGHDLRCASTESPRTPHGSSRVPAPLRSVPAGAAKVASAPGYGKYVGRVSGLAVALGIGVAIVNGASVAAAETGESGSASETSSSASAGSSKEGTSEDKDKADASDSGSPGTPSSSGAETDDADDEAADGEADSPSSSSDPEDDLAPSDSGSEQTDPADTPDGAVGSTDNVESDASDDLPEPDAQVEVVPAEPSAGSVPQEASEGESSSGVRDDTVDGGSLPAPSTEESGVATDGSSGPEVSSSDSAEQGDSLASPVAAADSSAVAPESNVATEFVSSMLTSVSLDSAAPESPAVAPITLWSILGSIWHQFQYTFFNSSPKLGYSRDENVQTFDGVVTGNLNVTDADGDTVTLTVKTAPKYGTLVLNQDGSFTYTPNPVLAVLGGTDTFTVVADDRPDNPFHLNLFKLLAPNWGATTTKTITITVEPTSPLGTADQVEAEGRVEAIVNSPAVQAAMAQLRAAWLADAQQKYALVGGPDAESLAQLEEAVVAYANFAALTAQNVDPNNPKIIALLLPEHDWYGVDAGSTLVTYNNPDGLYRITPVNSAWSYEIHGRFVGEWPSDVNFSVLAGGTGTTLSTLSMSDLVVEEDGTFTITISAAAAAPGQTNHLQITSATTAIIIRDTFGDWNAETPMSLTIERVTGPEIAPMSYEQQVQIAAQITAGGALALKQWTALATTDLVTGLLREPNVVTAPAKTGTDVLTTQLQSVGYFQLEDDEAMVITIDPGRAGYFVVPVTNVWTIFSDVRDVQNSLNNTQAVANADGTYTFVISKTDPGVANWVSTGGLSLGSLFIRFQQLDASSTVDPTLHAEVVTLDELDEILPADTKYLTAAERQEQLELRQEGYDTRFSPFPYV